MIRQALVPVVLLFGAGVAAADDLPPRALAQLGDRRFYHGPGVECAVLSPDGKLAASAAHWPSYFRHLPDPATDTYERTVVLWDAATGNRVREIRIPESKVWALAFAPDGQVLAVSGRAGVAIYDGATGKLVRELEEVERTTGRLLFSADGMQVLVRAGLLGEPTAWDNGTGRRVRQWKMPAGPSEWVKEREMLAEAVPSPDGRSVAWLLYQVPDYSKVPIGVFPPPPDVRPTAVLIADAVTGKPRFRHAFEATVDSFAFSADGRRYLIVAKDQVTVRDTATGKELAVLKVPGAHKSVFSPDGKQAVVADGRSRVGLWDLGTAKRTHELTRGDTYFPSGPLESLQAFSADGRTLILTTDTTLRLYDLTTGREWPAAGHRSPPVPRFAADGRTLLTTCNESRRTWDLSPGRAPTLLAADQGNGVHAQAHSPDGRLFTDDADRKTRLRESATGRVVCVLEADSGRGYRRLFSPNAGRLLVQHSGFGGDFNGLRLFDARTGKDLGRFETKADVGNPVYSPDGRLVAWADRAGAVHLHDAGTGALVRTVQSAGPVPPEGCNTARLVFTPGGKRLIVTAWSGSRLQDQVVVALPTRVLHVATGREVGRFYLNPVRTDQAAELSCAVCSPDGRLLAAAEEEAGTIRLIELVSGKVRVELNGHRHGVAGLAFAPDGRSLASGGADNVVYLWDVTGAQTGPAGAAGERELAVWWADLAGDDAARAAAALAGLVRAAGPGAAFVSARLKPAATPDPKELTQRIADLDSGTFATRERATRELARLGERAEAELRRALKTDPSAELVRRVEDLLERLDRVPPPETLRDLRAIEALEHLDTAEAIRGLERMAGGDPAARAAKAALGRRTGGRR